MRAKLALVLALLASASLVPVRGHAADAPRAMPADRGTVEACIERVRQNAAKDAQGSDRNDEAPGAEGRLAAAAREAGRRYESCIGIVTLPCQQQPGGETTAGMVSCNEREWAVWDERLNRAYRKALKDADARTGHALGKVQHAWLAWRDERCALPAAENEGGTIVGPLMSACLLETTAQQALWLEERR